MYLSAYSISSSFVFSFYVPVCPNLYGHVTDSH